MVDFRKISTGPLRASSLSPSCSRTAVITSEAVSIRLVAVAASIHREVQREIITAVQSSEIEDGLRSEIAIYSVN